ncbi:MAG: hypothetical protein K2K12_06465, partial [Clostridia bacterium]|nr:hypothetical protein [Clostridia bacterium]
MINCFNVVSLLLAGSFLIGAGTSEAVPAARRRTVEWESVPFTLLSPARINLSAPPRQRPMG